MLARENRTVLGCWWLGRCGRAAGPLVAIPGLPRRDLEQIRDHPGTRRAFFTTGVSKEAAAEAARYGANVQSIGPLQNIGVSPRNEHTTPEPVEADAAKQVAVLIYTSGTTGTPKGVMLTHQNLLFSAKTTAWFRRMDANDNVYVVLPISHIVGISLLIMTLTTAAPVRLVCKYHPAALAKP